MCSEPSIIRRIDSNEAQKYEAEPAAWFFACQDESPR